MAKHMQSPCAGRENDGLTEVEGGRREGESTEMRGRGSGPHCSRPHGKLLHSMALILSSAPNTPQLSLFVSTSPKLLTVGWIFTDEYFHVTSNSIHYFLLGLLQQSSLLSRCKPTCSNH